MIFYHQQVKPLAITLIASWLRKSICHLSMEKRSIVLLPTYKVVRNGFNGRKHLSKFIEKRYYARKLSSSIKKQWFLALLYYGLLLVYYAPRLVYLFDVLRGGSLVKPQDAIIKATIASLVDRRRGRSGPSLYQFLRGQAFLHQGTLLRCIPRAAVSPQLNWQRYSSERR